MKLEGVAGPQNIADGASNAAALSRSSELLVTEYHGRYKELAARNNLFHVVTGAITVTTTNVSPLGAGGVPLLALYNPLNSGKNAALLRHHVATISGTPGGPMLWNFSINQALTNGVSAFIQTYPGNLAMSSPAVVRAISNIALGGSTLMALLKIASAIPAVATAYAPIPQEEEAGTIVIPPGGILAMAAYAAGTSHVMMASATWEEFPV